MKKESATEVKVKNSIDKFPEDFIFQVEEKILIILYGAKMSP